MSADDLETSTAAKPTAYQPRRARSLSALLLLTAILAVLALAGIAYAVFSTHEDPNAIQIPVHTSKSLAEEQPIPEPQAHPSEEHREMIEQQNSVLPQAEPQQHETPLQLNSTPLTPDKPAILKQQKPNVAPQSMMQIEAPKIAAINGHGKQIVIVIDDMGLNRKNSQMMVDLPAALTLSYLPYAEHLAQRTDNAWHKGHELIVHVPMEPDNLAHNNPGPNALLSNLPPEQNLARLDKNLNAFDHYIGLNNHMGSRMTSDAAAMRPVMQEIKQRHLWFLDSKTIGNSVAGKIAGEMGVPFATRDIFLDNTENVSAVLAQLHDLEMIAQKRHYAVAIGHPHDATITALKIWLPQALARGFEIVPLSTVIAERFPDADIPRYAQLKKNDSQRIAVNNR